MSKGSNRRPSEVPDEQLEDNWNRIFAKEKQRLALGQGYESCKETDTERTEAAKSRGVERR